MGSRGRSARRRTREVLRSISILDAIVDIGLKEPLLSHSAYSQRIVGVVNENGGQGLNAKAFLALTWSHLPVEKHAILSDLLVDLQNRRRVEVRALQRASREFGARADRRPAFPPPAPRSARPTVSRGLREVPGRVP